MNLRTFTFIFIALTPSQTTYSNLRCGVEAHYNFTDGPSVAITLNHKIAGTIALHYYLTNKDDEQSYGVTYVPDFTSMIHYLNDLRSGEKQNTDNEKIIFTAGLGVSHGIGVSQETCNLHAQAVCHYDFINKKLIPNINVSLNKKAWENNHPITRILASVGANSGISIAMILATRTLSHYNYWHNKPRSAVFCRKRFIEQWNNSEKILAESKKTFPSF